MNHNFESVNRAFTKQSDHYDIYDADNKILHWMRKRVRKHVQQYLKTDDRILELNAGTGLDAFYFAEQGFEVYATDLSDGMVHQIQQKISNSNLDSKLKVKQCSYTDLAQLSSEKFNYVFSNFGGLNCIPNINLVTDHLSILLKPGAIVTFVIMPPVCPWEIAKFFKGKWNEAFRRLDKNGSMAHLEGEYFKTYYFNPSSVIKAFGKNFVKVKLEGLATFSPPPYADYFPSNYPGLYRFLTLLDENVSLLPPFRSCADHFILTMKYVPNSKSGSIRK